MNADRAMISSIWFDHHWFSRYLGLFLFSPSLLWPYSTKKSNRNFDSRATQWKYAIGIFEHKLCMINLELKKISHFFRNFYSLRLDGAWKRNPLQECWSNLDYIRMRISRDIVLQSFHQILSSLWGFSDNLKNFWFLRFQNLMSSDRDGGQ